MRQRQTQCLAIIPLLSGGNVIGTIGLDTTDPEHIFSDAEISLAETMASQMANTIEKQRLYRTDQTAFHEQITAKLTANLSRSLDMEKIMQTIRRAQSHARCVTCRGANGHPRTGKQWREWTLLCRVKINPYNELGKSLRCKSFCECLMVSL